MAGKRSVHAEPHLLKVSIEGKGIGDPQPPSGWRGSYMKAREMTAGDFPMVSVAAGFALQQGMARHVRIVLGTVAPVPWRAPAAEAVLEGRPVTPERAAEAAEAALAGAQPMSGNAYKLGAGRALIVRALLAIALPRA